MAFDTAYPQILANLAAGNEPIAIIDSNFTPLYGGLNSLNTFGNYYADSGAANAYVVTITARQTATLAAGLMVQFKAANANTTASTLNVSGTGAKNILNFNGTALTAGQIPANAVVNVMYDGTQYLLLGWLPGTTLTNSLAADVALNNTANYFTGPTVAQGTVGTWWAAGTVSVQDGTAGANQIVAKLWDGTTVISSAIGQFDGGTNSQGTLSLSGLLAAPAGNLRISVRDASTAAGKILFNGSGNSKDSTISAFRIG